MGRGPLRRDRLQALPEERNRDVDHKKEAWNVIEGIKDQTREYKHTANEPVAR